MLPRGILFVLLCREVFAAPYDSENARWNVNFEVRHEPAEYYGAWPGHRYHPSPEDWRALSIYQLLTDRFADGDPTNNEAFATGFDVRDMTYRHGGDFAGLTQKLSYIKGLGCEAIWISPIFQNGPNMYHQYAQHDFTLLDRRLGTLEELRNLTSEAHRLGMYVIVDVVMNHMDNEFFFEGHEFSSAPFRWHGDTAEQREYKLMPRRAAAGLFETPAGRQPYQDFWYNNTWDAEAQYQGRTYGQWGESEVDEGRGTYPGSDFHHNGDLKDYFKPWEINLGKIYGTMDDLRLEHPRVQEKYIAMTKALIASTDVDGFRVDTPMQVPLPFFKAWAPAVRDFARSLGKERFAMFGEFYVTPYRYATMTGRGKDNTMYGRDAFIDDRPTLKGGIVYSYYWYTFTAMVYEWPELADGLPLAYRKEADMLDVLDPSTGRQEYSMWNFCNNHDNWRLQVMTGNTQMRMCLAVITFWPGVPLHYAGDEQGFNTPGSALDGWAREELSVSLAWRAVRTSSSGNPADGDNFDMTSGTYRYIQRLNALRRAYFGNFSSEQCDVVESPEEPIPEVLVFTRGCTDDSRITLVANYRTKGSKTVRVVTSWPPGTELHDVLPEAERFSFLVADDGSITATVPALGAMVLAVGFPRPLPPSVVSISPGHGTVLEPQEGATSIEVTIRFDRAMEVSVVEASRLDGSAGGFWCATSDCSEITASLELATAEDGLHTVEVDEGAVARDGLRLFAAFRSSFRLARRFSSIAHPNSLTQSGLICRGHTALCHQATGADFFRAQNVGEDWSEWRPYEGEASWVSYPGTPVLVQYHAEGSSGYIVGDCLDAAGGRCFASWHPSMHFRGEWNNWGRDHDGAMHRVDDFQWGARISVRGYAKAKFAPFQDWSKSYGAHADRPLLYNLPDYDARHRSFDVKPTMSGSEASRRWMASRGLWSAHEALASGADFATELWVGSGCTAEAPFCPVPDDGDWTCVGFKVDQNMDWCRAKGIDGCEEYAENDGSPSMDTCKGCSCCKRKVTPVLDGPETVCCVLFNDLLLNYTITSDLSLCAAVPEDVTTTRPAPVTELWTTTPPPPCEQQPAPEIQGEAVREAVRWSEERLVAAEREFDGRGNKRMASPTDWHNEVSYSVLVDRFANGDIKNDMSNIPDFQKSEMESGKPFSLPRWRHGGDLLGLKGRLTYLRELGVTIVGISPLFKNSRGDYDASCSSDILTVDPGFGSAELLRELVHDAHSLGMRVVLEVEVSHICGRGLGYTKPPGVDAVTSCVERFAEAYWNGTRGGSIPDDSRGELRWADGDLPMVLQHPSFFARCGPQNLFRPGGKDMSELPEATPLAQAGVLWTEPSEFDGHGNLLKVQFNTLDIGFQRVYTNLLKWWVAYADVDGYRVLSAGQVSADFTSYLSTNLRSYAMDLGKENFMVVGELDLSTAPFAAQQLGRVRPGTELTGSAAARLPEVLEGVLRETCLVSQALNPPWPGLLAASTPVEAFHLRRLAGSEAQPSEFYGREVWREAMDRIRGIMDTQADLRSTWTGFEVRRQPPLLSLVGEAAATEPWRLQVGLAWSMTWYGIPEIVAGSELGLNGLCFKSPDDRAQKESELRDAGFDSEVVKSLLDGCDYSTLGSGVHPGYWHQDLFVGGPLLLGSAIGSVQAHSGLRAVLMGASGPHWCEDPLLDRSNPIYRTVRAMARLRRSCPALRSSSDRAAEVLKGPRDELAYWKLGRSEAWQSSSGPSAMLVVLKFSSDPGSDASWAEYAMPEGLEYKEGQAFVDMLSPSRLAMVVQKNGRLSLLLPAVMERSHVAVFAPNGEVEADEGGGWLVCTGGDLPPLPHFNCEVNAGQLFLTWGGFVLAAFVVVMVLLRNCRSHIYLAVVRESTAPARPSGTAARVTPKHVLTAAIEHTVPERGVKVSAGGLGKVLDQMLREHPEGTLSLVHPMFGDVDYGKTELFKELEIVVDGKVQVVKVYTLASEHEASHGKVKRVWYLLSHDYFSGRSRRQPYPSPMTKLCVLRYFSLWNQTIALLIQDLKPDVYHCMDYHGALAPLYVSRDAQVPTILVLHNADYMGVIETDFINDRFWKTVPALRRLSLVFNLKRSTIRKYTSFEGRFNMLHAGVEYIKEVQAGWGVCAVSASYGAELLRERTLFSGLPGILALDNATDPAEDSGRAGIDALKRRRFEAKAALQAHCGLEQDPEAKILIFIGRWVKQKGVDHIAMLTPVLLQSHPEVQIVLAGPPDDACGLYAQELLAPVQPRFDGRLFVCTEFFALPAELRRGAHLCLAPSCSEPFGYVDVEFGLLGVPSVGCAVGGLGKMPGVYFRQQNADSSQMLLEAFLCSVDYALNMPDADYWEMALAATKAVFPFETWRENLLEAYTQATGRFRPSRDASEHTLNDLWLQNAAVDIIRGELAQRKESVFRPISDAALVAQQMQVLDVDDDMEFLTQAVGEERVHDIMKETMKEHARRRGAGRMVKDAETLQRNICLAEQRLSERNQMTQWLMKPLFQSKYLRIHAVVAICYVVAPAGESLLQVVSRNSSSAFLSDYTRHCIFYLGAAVGSLLWLGVSYGLPPNLLMACSQLANVLFSVLIPSLPGGFFQNEYTVAAFLAVNGALSSSRLLFIIWNFNEDFHGGFQVACKRIGLLESLRSIFAMVAVIISHAGMDYIYQQVVLIISLSTLVLLFKAPHCYCAYSLPPTGLFEGVFTRRSFVLLLISEMLNHLADYASQTYPDWWALNGWSTGDIIHFSWAMLLLSLLIVPLVFGVLMRLSVWGPWAMRDFTCIMPPGSLLRALALWDIGFLHHRSGLFAAAVVFSYVIDILRSASVFASMMSILGNKWYALKGCYFVLLLTAGCSAASPFVGNELAGLLCGTSPFERVTLDRGAEQAGSLGDAIFWAVVPLAATGYLFQLMTLRYFDADILTFRGHGCARPDGGRTGTAASSVRVPISQLRRMRRVAGSSALRTKVQEGGEDDGPQFDTEVGSLAPASEYRFRRDEGASEHRFSGDDAASRHCGSSCSGGMLSRMGSMQASELVSELEQQILFNLAERAGAAPPLSRASSASGFGPRLEDEWPAGLTVQRPAIRRSYSSLSEISGSAASVAEGEESEEEGAASAAGTESLEPEANPDFGDLCAI